MKGIDNPPTIVLISLAGSMPPKNEKNLAKGALHFHKSSARRETRAPTGGP
jgi:hypothetical protein